LLPIWSGEKTSVRDSVFLPFMQLQRSVRDERWKLIAYPKIGHLQLFDLQSDPHETKNLVDRAVHAEELARLQTLMRDWQSRWNDQLALPTKNKQPPAIDLSGRERKPDQWQPEWIVKKYFQSKMSD
jgi:arylsulfatase A-like enzyme